MPTKLFEFQGTVTKVVPGQNMGIVRMSEGIQGRPWLGYDLIQHGFDRMSD